MLPSVAAAELKTGWAVNGSGDAQTAGRSARRTRTATCDTLLHVPHKDLAFGQPPPFQKSFPSAFRLFGAS